MAMTAWAAKFVDQSDLLVGEGPNFLAGQGERTDQFVLLQHRDGQTVLAPPSSTAATDAGLLRSM